MHIKKASFSGHESFPFRSTWLTKGVLACAQDPRIFTQDEAMVLLGVGKNMVRSIRHWCLATKVLEEDREQPNNRGRYLRPTRLGERLFLGDSPWDRYLEDMGTLWLIHWLLVTHGTKATTWYYAFNEVNEPEFTRKRLLDAVRDLAQQTPGTRFSENTLKRDVDIFIRTYAGARVSLEQDPEDTLDCPLVELGLVSEQPEHGVYAFARGPKDSLPDSVFVYALHNYAAEFASGRDTFAFDELAYWPSSPGRIFKLDEASLADRLERLGELTGGAWEFSETAGLKQVLMTRAVDALQALQSYYQPHLEVTR